MDEGRFHVLIPRKSAGYSGCAHLDPGHADAHLGLASVSLLEQDYEAARTGFEHALSLDPGNVIARFSLGFAPEFLGNSACAMAHFGTVCANGHARACRMAGKP